MKKVYENGLISRNGELLRLRDVRGEITQPCQTNRGQEKGKALEQARLIYQHECLHCGKGFDGIAKAAYCSNACRQKAKRHRAKAPQP